MITIEIAYMTASSLAIFAMAPQVKQLLITKRSHELNLFSWCIWTASQGVAILYGISLGALPYIIINSIWFAYYAVMVGLIIYYRHPRHSRNHEPAPQAEFEPEPL